jgi:hypothetical protein
MFISLVSLALAPGPLPLPSEAGAGARLAHALVHLGSRRSFTLSRGLPVFVVRNFDANPGVPKQHRENDSWLNENSDEDGYEE